MRSRTQKRKLERPVLLLGGMQTANCRLHHLLPMPRAETIALSRVTPRVARL